MEKTEINELLNKPNLGNQVKMLGLVIFIFGIVYIFIMTLVPSSTGMDGQSSIDANVEAFKLALYNLVFIILGSALFYTLGSILDTNIKNKDLLVKYLSEKE